MPKAAAKNSTTRKHGQSAKKGRTAQTQTDSDQGASTSADASTSAASDPSQWRASKLRDSDTITKGDAEKQYRLKKPDFEGIPFQTEQTVVQGRLVRPMYIYKERNIERRAWERHGGPEVFDKYLAKWRESYLKKNGPRAHFTQPRTYEDPRGEVSIVSIKPGISRLGPVDPYVGRSPTLLNVKNQMAPWLWTAYNKALSAIDDLNWEASAFGGPGFFMRDKDREGPMKDALVLAPTYPPRHTEPLPSSASVDKVRAVLAEAANLPEGGPGWGRDDVPGLTFVSGYGGAGEPFDYYEWSGDYFESLFAALIEVIDAHGLGPEGLEGIRWEVYDKFVKCMHAGPHYDRGEEVWTDKAAEWLDGQFASVADTCRAKCAAGRRYNDILPRRHRRGHPSVGVRPH